MLKLDDNLSSPSNRRRSSSCSPLRLSNSPMSSPASSSSSLSASPFSASASRSPSSALLLQGRAFHQQQQSSPHETSLNGHHGGFRFPPLLAGAASTGGNSPDCNASSPTVFSTSSSTAQQHHLAAGFFHGQELDHQQHHHRQEAHFVGQYDGAQSPQYRQLSGRARSFSEQQAPQPAAGGQQQAWQFHPSKRPRLLSADDLAEKRFILRTHLEHVAASEDAAAIASSRKRGTSTRPSTDAAGVAKRAAVEAAAAADATTESLTNGSTPSAMLPTMQSQLKREVFEGLEQNLPRKLRKKALAASQDPNKPLFTLDDVKVILDAALDTQSSKLSLEYDDLLQQKLHEQYENFTEFSREYLSRTVRDSDCSYIS